jgi:hypothetical protein
LDDVQLALKVGLKLPMNEGQAGGLLWRTRESPKASVSSNL